MNRIRWLFGLTLTVLALAAATAPLSSALPAEKDRWIEINTHNFTLYSEVDKRTTMRLAVNLEQLRAVLGQLTRFRLRSPVPTVIFVFSGDRDFNPYKRLHRGKPAAIGGYFVRRPTGNYIALKVAATDATARIYHEYLHFVVRNNSNAPVPVWVDEGVAEFYRTFEIRDNHAHVGGPISRHVALLHKMGLMIPLAQLVAVNHSSPLYNQSEVKAIFYAQSWALVHYLLAGNEQRAGQLQRYLELTAENLARDEAFRQAFGADYTTLEKELKSYVDRFSFPTRVFPVDVELDEGIEVRPMAYHEVLYHLGDLLANQLESRHQEAAEHFQAALRVKPDYGPAVGGLGYLAAQQGKSAQAREHYERAVELAPGDFLLHYRYAGSLLQDGGHEARRQARGLLRRSIALNPHFAPSWARLAEAYASEDPLPDEALVAAKNAHKLLPSRIDVARLLLSLYLRTGNRDAGQALVDHYFTARANPRELEQTRFMLVTMDVERAFALVEEGKYDEALQQLEQVKAEPAGASHRSWIDEQISRLRRYIAQHRFNEAMAHFDAGDYEAARTILVELSTAMPEGSLADRVRVLLERISAPGRRRSAIQHDDMAGVQGEIKQIDRLVAQNNLEEALRLLEQMDERPSRADLRAWIRAKITVVRTAIEYNRYVDRYNEAVDLFNAGDYAAVCKILAQLMATMPEHPLTDKAQALLERAKTALNKEIK